MSQYCNPRIEDYVIAGFTLVFQNYIPDYIDVLMTYELEIRKKELISNEELRCMIILRAVFSRSFACYSYDYFYMFVSGDCPGTTRDEVCSIMGYLFLPTMFSKTTHGLDPGTDM